MTADIDEKALGAMADGMDAGQEGNILRALIANDVLIRNMCYRDAYWKDHVWVDQVLAENTRIIQAKSDGAVEIRAQYECDSAMRGDMEAFAEAPVGLKGRALLERIAAELTPEPRPDDPEHVSVTEEHCSKHMVKAELHCPMCDSEASQQPVAITGETSDGYHTFSELYEHRHALFASLAGWKSKLHSDGTMFDGRFIAGRVTKCGQITYHIPMRLWGLYDVIELEKAPEWDGHTSDDVIKRLHHIALDAPKRESVDPDLRQLCAGCQQQDCVCYEEIEGGN